MTMPLAHEEDYKDFKIKIHYDQDPINPLVDYDQAAVLICWHRRYDLGHSEKVIAAADGLPWSGRPSIESFQEWAKSEEGETALILPLYLYDHSGITISCSAFSCPWDSGQVGYVVMTRAMILKEFGAKNGKRVTKQMRAKAEKLMRAEVETYDMYLTGQCYGYTVEDADGNEIDNSCWGFLGEMEYPIEEARAAVDQEIRARQEKTAAEIAADMEAPSYMAL